jgi:antitoxin (DNA-binding transcriptional repressor) of toxin-antitoxin stability system
MKTVSVGEFKTNLSHLIQEILKGEELVVTHGRNKRKIFKISPFAEVKTKKRKLGILKGKLTVKFHKDWDVSEEELLDL